MKGLATLIMNNGRIGQQLWTPQQQTNNKWRNLPLLLCYIWYYIYISPLLYLICNIHYNNLSASHFFVLSNGYKSFSFTFLFRTRLFGITIIRKAIVHSFIKNYLILRTMASFTINLIIPTFWKGCLALSACEASCMVIALPNSQNLL